MRVYANFQPSTAAFTLARFDGNVVAELSKDEALRLAVDINELAGVPAETPRPALRQAIEDFIEAAEIYRIHSELDNPDVPIDITVRMLKTRNMLREQLLTLGVPPAAPPTQSEVQIAERIARRAHDGQKDTVTGAPYITHVERVVAMVEGDDAKAVAWLHDVLEDCDEWTYNDLMREGISQRVCDAVDALTRQPQIGYAEYIEQIRMDGNTLVLAVKIADLQDHLRPNGPARLRPRYIAALKELDAPAAAKEK